MRSIITVLFLACVLSACGGLIPPALPATPTLEPSSIRLPTQTSSSTPAFTATIFYTLTPSLTPTHTAKPPTPTATNTRTPLPMAPAPTQSVSHLPDISANYFLDDRSTPAAMMFSFFNAINRGEMVRAYSYYYYNKLIVFDPATINPGSYADSVSAVEQKFYKSYGSMQSVAVTAGSFSTDGAAGSETYTIPLALEVVTTTGEKQKLAACYVLNAPQSGGSDSAKIVPMTIARGIEVLVAPDMDNRAVIAGACGAPDFTLGSKTSPASMENLSDLSRSNYIDNRSGPVEMLSSALNALVRGETGRANSYWSQFFPEYGLRAFMSTFGESVSVSAQFGEPRIHPSSLSGFTFDLYVIAKATRKNGTSVTSAGCYNLSISGQQLRTGLYSPMQILSGAIRSVDNDPSLAQSIAAMCAK